MKPRIQLTTSLLCLGTLLGLAAHAHATNIADLPLKASVLAKPNVIFGLDDSGSMDSEVMINTNDGAYWWDYSAASGWDGSGKPWFNGPGDATSRWRKMVYLFPNGTNSGARIYNDDDYAHFAIPPTAQFAFLRSASYNPLYYDPAVTYKPWSPAYVGGAKVTYADASTTAAKSHPVHGSETFDLSAARALTTSANHTFMAFAGMTVPAGTQTCTHDNNGGCSGGWTPEAAERTVPAGTVLRLALEYYPATYYVKESCTADGSTCVTAPDGATLKRYEIKAGNSFPSGRSHADELQNFANWFQYYRKRKLMLAAAMGKVLEPLTGLRMGVVRFNSRSTVTMYDTDATSPSANGLKVAGIFYETSGSGGTPTRETLKYIGDQFRNTTGVVQYACQRNNAFVVTDGFANKDPVSPPSYDKATWGPGVPYATTYDGTLADIALSYYTVNLKPALATGKVPKTAVDINPDLHMNTYGLTLGARGTIFAGESTPLPTSAGDWPNPTAARSPTAVDDLWHATINGRGKMYLATTPEETAIRIQSGLTDILSQTGAQGGIAVSTVNLPRGDNKAYFGTYNPAGWAGDLTANAIDPATGSVSTSAIWSAAAKLAARDWTTRVIATSNGTSGMAFTAANVGSIVNPGGVYGTDAAVVDYLRGNRSGEGSTFRSRTSLMGAVINSEPVVAREDGVVYVASGEGMLHAFDTSAGSAGQELWAFVPSRVLPTLGESVERGYAFGTKLDGSPVIGKVGTSKRLLVAGMGVAGRGYYALDVSNPRGLSEAGLAGKLKWEFPAAGDSSTQAKVGQTLGRPVIVKTAADGYVVLLTSGYNATADGKGRLWMLNADTGAVIKEFVVPAGTLANESGLAHVTAFGESTATVRYVYGGDLLGNVWRFDLVAKDDPAQLATLLGPAGDAQPVTAAPELLMHEGQRIVFLGTGRLLDISDFGSSKVQTIYAIADGPTLTNARTTLVQQTYDRATDSLSTNPVNWATQRGWFVDLPAGEQINTRPTIAYGGLAFVSNINGGADCSASSYLYVVGALTGKKFPGTAFVGTLVSNTSNSSGVTALLTTGQKIVGAGQDADGKPWERQITSGSPILPGKNAWIEIRR
ncbi:MAG: pyrrolo-quinoline quinone [Burkholderiales bacterium]|nr:pyrrolo-quinoline quinone [Burkholderiales bacterium]